MCGIVAQFNKNGQPPDENLIKRMAADINHRGPDDEGLYTGSWFGLGFKRLAILDLTDSGHQPMFDEQKRFVIVYNGELYNYKQLRAQLKGSGYQFFSETDTEVVLKAFMEWGPKCLDKFTGMFAFIIIDLRKDTVFAARDHLGIKPLYIFRDKNVVLFASEVKCFRHYVNFELNESALFEQLHFRYVGGERTIFKNICRLDAGTYITFDREGILKQNKYYNVISGLEHSDRSFDLLAVERELKESILCHTQSDVGYNVQLSGGVDSSYITAVLAKDYQQELHTYSVTVDGYERDESTYQKIVSDLYRTTHHSLRLEGSDLKDDLPKATWHMDMPLVHINCAFLMHLCGLAKQRSKVILTGEGADELFCGYKHYDIPLKRQFVFQLKRLGLNPALVPRIWKFKSLRTLLTEDIGLNEQAIYTHGRGASFFTGLHKDISCRMEVYGRYHNLVNKITAADQVFYLSTFLERQDKMAMAMSVEARVPFCTWKLFDLVNAYKEKDKIKPVPKIILKKIAEKYFDRAFVYRPKIGFSLPLNQWLRDKKSLGQYLDLITDTTFAQRGFYNTRAIAKAVDDHIIKKIDRDKELINLIVFELWHRMFIDKQIRYA